MAVQISEAMPIAKNVNSPLRRARPLNSHAAPVLPFDLGGMLGRGYSLTRNARGEVVVDAARVVEGEVLTTMLSKGWIESEVRTKGR